MTYTGMRKGISLVEMMIAVVLFAVLSAIGLKYIKSYINADLAAKKARVAALSDAAGQIAGAYNIYTVEKGVAPTSLSDLNATNIGIMTALPADMKELSTTGWELNTSADGWIALQFKLDLNGTISGTKADEEYCNLFNREFNSSLDVNVTDGQTFFVTDFNTTKATWGNNFCYKAAASDIPVIYVILP